MASSRTLGGYRLVAGLGKGGMARVFLALAQKAGGFTKLLVLKVLRTDLDTDGGFVSMFAEEARLAARLNHPNVVQTYEVGNCDGTNFIAMEYLEGQSLHAVLSRIGYANVPLEVQLRVLCDILEGLGYAHELTDYDGSALGVVHRDVSPQNIFVLYTGQAKLVDFGIAKVVGAEETQKGIVKGKVGYLAPEQVTGKAVDRRADLYAVGVVLWEALTKRRFVQRGEDEAAAFIRRMTGTDPRVSDIAPDAATELVAICDRAMATAPEARFASATEMRDAIEAYLRHGASVDARSVASLLNDHFAEDRARIRQLVEEQVKAIDETGPMLELVTETTATPLSHGGTLPMKSAPFLMKASPRSKNRILPVAVATTLVVLVVAGLTLAMPSNRLRTKEASAETAASDASFSGPTNEPSPPAPTASDTIAVPATVRIAIQATPATATVTFDGKRVANPWQTTGAKDGSSHRLQVTAVGYSAESRTLVMDRDYDEVVALGRPTKPQGARLSPDPEMVKPKRPKHTVDEKDPYE